MIQLEKISKWYNTNGTRNFVLKDVHLTINEGEFISVMGQIGFG
ncbi:MAG: hypothetical protein QM737_20025 [Ferruginibacter sp.]